MIGFLKEISGLLVWSGSLLALTALLWAVPKTRRMPGYLMTGWKSMPAGCAVTALVPVLGILLMYWSAELLEKSCRRVRDWGGAVLIFSVPFFWFPLGIICAILTVAGLCRILRKKYLAETDPMGMAFVVLMILAYSWIFLIFRDFHVNLIHPR
ncbi:MAG: hypothetical protein IJS14_02720 [Lentisphaeria bacterium]|nr:hypothetical protein [Lentisphaeria bacterium]